MEQNASRGKKLSASPQILPTVYAASPSLVTSPFFLYVQSSPLLLLQRPRSLRAAVNALSNSPPSPHPLAASPPQAACPLHSQHSLNSALLVTKFAVRNISYVSFNKIISTIAYVSLSKPLSNNAYVSFSKPAKPAGSIVLIGR